MEKQHRIEDLLKQCRVKSARSSNCQVAPSVFLDIQDKLFLGVANFTAEEVASHKFIVNCIADSKQSLKDASALLYPISLAVLTDRELPDQYANQIIEEIAQLRRLDKPMVFLSLFDFSLSLKTRTTPLERRLEKLIQQTQKLNRLEFLLPQDRLVQFECTQDLDQHCTVFPLINVPLIKPARQRKWLFNFVGKTTKSHWIDGMVRSPDKQKIWNRIAHKHAAHSFIGNDSDGAKLIEGNPFYQIPAQSVFTLCPRGIGNWTFRLYEAILCGSIPIIMSDSFIPPYPGMDWEAFSIRVPERELTEIGDFIASIPQQKIDKLQEQLSLVQYRFEPTGLRNLFVDWMSHTYS